MKTSILKTLLTVLLIPFFSQPVLAANALHIGDALPQTISLKNQLGEEKSFKELSGKNGTILFFYLSSDWCMYCKAQIIDMRNNLQEFKNEGYSLVGVSYDSFKDLQKFDNKYHPGFTLLSDPNSVAIKKFGIFDGNQREGSFAYGIAKPTVYIVNNDQVITSILAEDSYKLRPQIKAIMTAIRKTRGFVRLK